MSTTQTDQSSEKPIVEESRLQYVDDLAGPEDYWISITDAARVTRTSEAMARRWVTSGRLPVKRDPVGLNQRTRMVRASDLQKIRAIIDPSAAITDDVRKLDLVSIPKQQHEIMEEQHRLVRLVDEVREVLSAQETLLQEQTTVLREEIVDEGLRIGREIEGLLQPMRETFVTQEQATTQVQESILAQGATIQQELVAQETRTQAALAALHETIESKILQVVQPIRDDLAHQLQTITAQEQALVRLQETMHQSIGSLRTDLEQHQANSIDALRLEVKDLIEQRWHDASNAIQTLERDCVRDLADFTQKLEQYDEQVVQLRGNMDANRSIALGSQKRVDRQDEQIAELKRQLEEEVLARQVLSDQVAALVAAVSVEKSKSFISTKTRKRGEANA